ncbi:MAG: Clp protease N-terminal domain-containing protein [Pseudonocardiaceae bacterium]
MFERFTAQARAVVVGAQREARELRHPHIGTEHLLLALLSEEAGVAYAVLHAAGMDGPRARADVERLAGTPSKILTDEDAAALQTIGIDLATVLNRIKESFGPDALLGPPETPRRGLMRRRQGYRTRLTRHTKKVLELSLREAIRLGHNYIGSEHILLGLLRDGDGLAVKILTENGLILDELRRATLTALDKAA